jgi:single-stranded DNA-binding protein
MNSILKSLTQKSIRNLSTLGSVNQVTLVGTISSDPKISVKENDQNKTSIFSLETIRYVDRINDGIDLHRVVVNDQKLNNYIEKFKIVKGDQLYVNGQIQYSRISDPDGRFRYVTYIDAKNISIMSRKRESSNTISNNDENSKELESEISTIKSEHDNFERCKLVVEKSKLNDFRL